MPLDDNGTWYDDSTAGQDQPSGGQSTAMPGGNPDFMSQAFGGPSGNSQLDAGAQFALSLIDSFGTTTPNNPIVGEGGAAPADAARVGGSPVADQIASQATANANAQPTPWSFDGILKMVNNLGSWTNKNQMATIAIGGAAKALLDRQDKKQMAEHYQRADATAQQLANLAQEKQQTAATSGENIKVNAGSATPQLGIIGGFLDRRKRSLAVPPGAGS